MSTYGSNDRLALVWAHLLTQARTRPGTVARYQLKRGARLAVKVLGGDILLTISRPEQPVGAVELDVFRQACQVPLDAVRIPPAGQGEKRLVESSRPITLFYVAYAWPDTPTLPPAPVAGNVMQTRA